VIPAIYALWRGWGMRRLASQRGEIGKASGDWRLT